MKKVIIRTALFLKNISNSMFDHYFTSFSFIICGIMTLNDVSQNKVATHTI